MDKYKSVQMKKILFNIKFLRLYFFITLLSIEFLATTRTNHIVLVEGMWDKLNHFIAFFVLYILLSLAYQNLNIFVKICLLLIFGLQIEVVQDLIGRSLFSSLDILADSIGILTIWSLKRFTKVFSLVRYDNSLDS